MANGRGRLVGRRHESQALRAALERLGRHRPAFVALSGEPGIGKTRLLEELAAGAEELGHVVLSGRGTELERELPFGVWVDALDDHVAWLGHDRIRRMLRDQADELARVLPSAAEARDAAPSVAMPDDRFRTHRAARTLLERMPDAQPLTLLLDDLHWADGASLELLAYLLRRPPRAQLLLAAAFRPGLPASLLNALREAGLAGLVVELPLGPLEPGDVSALVGRELRAPAREDLHRVTGGNPFYMLELARFGTIAGRPTQELMDAAGGVPPAVAAALGEEIGALAEPARRFAQGAAIAGDPFTLELAAAAADLTEARALVALDEVVAAGLLHRTGVGRQYRFRHPIVRRAVYESSREGWRLAAHARAAAALSDAGGSLAAQAHHIERSARPGDQDALALLAAAAREATARAPAAAARWYAAVLRLLPDRPESAQQRLELLVPLATAQAALGRLEQALATLLAALDILPPSHADLRVRVIAACAGFENLLGRHRAAHERLVSTLRALPEPRSAAGGALQVELAADALFDTNFTVMEDWADTALTTARELQDQPLTAVAAALVCFARYGKGKTAAAERARYEAAQALDALPDEALAARLDAPYYLGYAEFFCERYDDAIGHFQRGVALSRATAQGQFLVPMLVGLAHALEVRGRLRQARETAEDAVEGARLAGNRQVASWALVAEGWIAAVTGDVRRAIAAAEEAVDLLRGLDESVLTLAAHAHAAAIFVETGQMERALEEARLAGAPALPRIEPGRRAWLQAALARAELARGHLAGAEGWLARAERAAAGLQLPLADSAVLHARATLALERGDACDAARLAERAAEAAAAVGADVQAARARALAGRARARAGEREAALALLAQAEAELTACGAHRLRDETAQDLRRLGRRVAARQRRSAGADELGRLSGREREIAELVALGRTNREIAGELFLAEKTVEGHLSNAFSKLGLASRAEVAALIGRWHAGTG